MRIAALYDIHANLPALDAVLAAVEHEGVDRVVIGGDVVPGPLPIETIERLRALGERAAFVRGNGDRWVVDAFDALNSATVDPERTRRPWAVWTAEVNQPARSRPARLLPRAREVRGRRTRAGPFLARLPTRRRRDADHTHARATLAVCSRGSRRAGDCVWPPAYSVRPSRRAVAGHQCRLGRNALRGSGRCLLAAARPRDRTPANRLRRAPRPCRNASGRESGHRRAVARLADCARRSAHDRRAARAAGRRPLEPRAACDCGWFHLWFHVERIWASLRGAPARRAGRRERRCDTAPSRKLQRPTRWCRRWRRGRQLCRRRVATARRGCLSRGRPRGPCRA